MLVDVYKKIISRNDTPYNRETDGKIKEIKKEFITRFTTSIVPEIGEILYFETEEAPKKYEVIKKIRVMAEEPYFVLEVVDYKGYHYMRYGSDAWHEYIPTVLEIED